MSATDVLVEMFAALPPWWVVAVVSMLPLVELRGSLPLALITYGMPWYLALPWCVLWNVLPVPFILRFFKHLEPHLLRIPGVRSYFLWLFARTRRKACEKIARYEVLGLLSFVAVPLPMTGAWTGSLAAYLFDLERKRATATIGLGVVLAGFIVLGVASAARWVFDYWNSPLLVGIAIALIALLGWLVLRALTPEKGARRVPPSRPRAP